MTLRNFLLGAALLAAAGGMVHAAPPRSAFYAGAKHELFYYEHSPEPAAVDVRARVLQGSRDLASEQAAARDEHLTLDPAKLQQPLPPAGENAAPVYLKLIQLLKNKPLALPDYADGMSIRHAYTPEQIGTAQKIYDSRPDVWNLVHEAADKPQCVFSRNWSAGPALLFPEFATVRAAARLLETESYLREHQGNTHEAVHAASRGLRLAGHAGSDPSLISYLVGCACDAIALQSFSGILAQSGADPAVCTEVGQAITANRPTLSLRSSLIGDMAGFSGYLDQARVLLADDKQYPGVTKKLPILAVAAQDLPAFSVADRKFLHLLWDAQEADYLHNMRLLIENADAPPAVRNSVFIQPQASLEDTATNPVEFISNVLLPITAKVHTNGERVHTQEDVLISAAAALSAKDRTGQFPDTQTLTTLDAFSAKPLVFRREGSGFVLYSAGPDADFDGGLPGDPRQPTQSYFRYPAPAPESLSK